MSNKSSQKRTVKERKREERAILSLIYSDEKYALITPTEEPDFKIKHHSNGIEFGVEVTEFYYSQSRARINNIPGYVGKIISERKYKHKDDITTLAIKELALIPGDNRRTQRKISGIFQEQPNIDKFVNKVSELIEDKNRRFSKYIDGLDHVNLIVYDRECRLVGAPTDKFHYHFFKPKLEKALLDSKFREIFFITKLGTYQSPKHVYIPLKMLFLVAELYRFNFIIVSEYPKESLKYANEEPALLAEFLKWRGAKNMYFRNSSDGYEIVYGSSGVFITKANKVSIRGYNDYGLPAGFQSASDNKPTHFFDEKFKKIFDEYKSTHIFSMELHFNIKNNSSNH